VKYKIDLALMKYQIQTRYFIKICRNKENHLKNLY